MGEIEEAIHSNLQFITIILIKQDLIDKKNYKIKFYLA